MLERNCSTAVRLKHTLFTTVTLRTQNANSPNKLLHTLSIVHANYVVPVCITSHSFFRFYALALALYTLHSLL